MSTSDTLRTLFLIIAFIFCNFDIWAHDYSKVNKPKFIKYADESGLPPTMIEDICEGEDGRIWLATWRGIYNFDGISFSHYTCNSAKSNGHDSRFVSIASDSYHSIWSLTYDGILYLHPNNSDNLMPFLENVSFESIHSKGDGNVFFFSKNAVIYTSTPFSTLERLFRFPSGTVLHDVFRYKQDNVWALTSSGVWIDRQFIMEDELFCVHVTDELLYFGGCSGKIYIFEGNNYKIYETGIPSDLKFIAPIAGTDCILTGSLESGVYTYNLKTQELLELTFPFAGSEFEVLTDESGRIFLFSDDASLSIFSTSQWDMIPYYNPDTQTVWNPENTVHAALVSSRGQIWFSGSSRGLERSHMHDENINLIVLGNDAYATPGNSIRAIGDNKDGLVYVSTADNKIHLLDSEHKVNKVISVECSINDFAIDSEGRYWFATSDGLIENLSQTDFVPRYHKPTKDFYSLDSPTIRTLCATEYGRLWIGSMDGGISYMDLNDDSRKIVSKKNLLSFPTDKSHSVRHICQDYETGRIYGCGNLGIFYCDSPAADPERMSFKWLDQLSGQDFYHIMFSTDGLLYASTMGNGLLVVDNKDNGNVQTRYTVDNGLLSDYVLSTIEDNNGNIWIVTHAGLNRLNPTTGSIIALPQERFGSNILLNNTKPLATADGTLYFGTNKGLLYFNPDDILNSDYIPEILISDLFVGTERMSVPNGGTVRMQAGEKMMVRFKAVDMAAPERVVYAYQLLGKKPESAHLGNEGYVVLQDLRPGKHTLVLRSSNSDGQAVDNPYSINITVFPSLLLIVVFVGALLMLTGLACFWSIRASGRRKLVQLEDRESRLFVDRLNAYLSDNMDNADLCAADISNALGVSRSMLFSKCKEYLGTPPLELLATMRMKKAVDLLETSDMRIAQVAFMVGFNDSQYFSKVFKAHFGKTPTQYRRSVQELVQPSNEISPDTARNA